MIVCHIEAPATSHSRGLIYPIVFKYLYTDLMRDSHMLPYLGKHNWDDITKALAEADYQGDFSLEVFNFTRNIPKEELPLALKLASRIAHYLIDWVEDYRNQK